MDTNNTGRLRKKVLFFLSMGVLVLSAVVSGIDDNSLSAELVSVDFPRHLPSTAEWDPVEKAEEFAAVLHNAETVSEVQAVIHDILELIGVGVYDVYGTVVRKGAEIFADDFFLYDFETRLAAEGFLAQQYLSLDAVVESWRSMGIPIRPLGNHQTELVSVAEIEKTLRALRRTAEAQPEHPAGFWIRLGPGVAVLVYSYFI